MSRAEAGRATAEKNAKKTEAKVRGAVTALQFLQEKITITSVCKQAGISPNTAKKYLKKMGLI
jgi:methylphosphotriester-DNA--protein-cysteine methyltransferase